MKLKISIRHSLIISLIIVIAGMFFSGRFFLNQIKERDNLLKLVTENYHPSIFRLSELFEKFEDTQKIINYQALSSIENDKVFEQEFDQLFLSEIPDITKNLMRLSKKWSEEDESLMFETSQLILDSLYFSYKDYIAEIYAYKVSGENTNALVQDILENSEIIFLISEIEQNLNYLTDKRKVEINEFFNLISQKTGKLNQNTIIIALIIFFILASLSFFVIHQVRKHLLELKSNLNELSVGRIPPPIAIPKGSGFSEVASKLNKLFEYLGNLTKVSRKILNKDFETDFRPLGPDDQLGNAIMKLQEDLKKADDEEKKRQKEDFQRNWVSNGIAKINDILRVSADNIEDLAYEVIKELVEYTGAKVGGFFVSIEEENTEPFIELKASYAYDRKKYLQKKIFPGEGLIGRCLQENSTIYITELPEGYLSVKSGLGEDAPASILIVPLNMNEKIYGVLEIASFNDMEDYKIQFVETAAENIATTLSKVLNNLKTSQLLEQSKNK